MPRERCRDAIGGPHLQTPCRYLTRPPSTPPCCRWKPLYWSSPVGMPCRARSAGLGLCPPASVCAHWRKRLLKHLLAKVASTALPPSLPRLPQAPGNWRSLPTWMPVRCNCCTCLPQERVRWCYAYAWHVAHVCSCWSRWPTVKAPRWQPLAKSPPKQAQHRVPLPIPQRQRLPAGCKCNWPMAPT